MAKNYKETTTQAKMELLLTSNMSVMKMDHTHTCL